MEWLQDTNVLIAQALKWLSDGAVSSFSTGQEVTFKTGDGKTITGKANAQGEVEADGQVYRDVSMDAYGNYSTKETVEDAKNEYTHRAEEKKKAEEEAAFNARFPYGRPSDISRNLWRGHSGTDVKALQQALNELGFNAGEVDGIFGGQTWNALAKFKNKYGVDGEYGMQSKTKAAFRAIEYKTGGLADFTGPAWLDGTRSKPEYILNADQTKAFFTLVDVLGSLQAGNSKTAQNSGDNTYDIDINVESIGSDYDVEQLATTVKRLINEDARYRNNNAINLMR
jgi:peptidoglycan hydrolase-like protein with peptidoglycan-binding domain